MFLWCCILCNEHICQYHKSWHTIKVRVGIFNQNADCVQFWRNVMQFKIKMPWLNLKNDGDTVEIGLEAVQYKKLSHNCCGCWKCYKMYCSMTKNSVDNFTIKIKNYDKMWQWNRWQWWVECGAAGIQPVEYEPMCHTPLILSDL